ncbi:hypothetical protein [Massilia sp. NP310]|uniref:hypothetical protein n=1 Tax=Massilia sp. NP310 TaxID=2861282 RepID=UPI001C634E15|nr:hypothetical protein [Massilia sp. NP310]QYG01897.1 hypothetical protein KY496_00070 [Massilia sp. NP310]
MDQRTDRLMAVYVDLAVNIAGVYGMATAVRSLHECGASPAVVQRVVIDGGPRRGTTSARPEPSSRAEPHIPHTGAAGQ